MEQTITGWLLLITLGSVAGMLGQGARTVVGLKKVNDAAEEAGKEFSDLFYGTKLMISLLIGAVAGSFAALSTVTGLDKASTTQVLGLMAAGYAGTDFIEGFMSRMLPRAPEVPVQETVPQPQIPAPQVMTFSDDAVG